MNQPQNTQKSLEALTQQADLLSAQNKKIAQELRTLRGRFSNADAAQLPALERRTSQLQTQLREATSLLKAKLIKKRTPLSAQIYQKQIAHLEWAGHLFSEKQGATNEIWKSTKS